MYHRIPTDQEKRIIQDILPVSARMVETKNSSSYSNHKFTEQQHSLSLHVKGEAKFTKNEEKRTNHHYRNTRPPRTSIFLSLSLYRTSEPSSITFWKRTNKQTNTSSSSLLPQPYNRKPFLWQSSFDVTLKLNISIYVFRLFQYSRKHAHTHTRNLNHPTQPATNGQ